MSSTIRVRAVEGRKLPLVDKEGCPVQGAWIGYKAVRPARGQPPRFEIVREGVEITLDSHITRAIAQGDLELAESTADSEVSK